MTTRHIGGKVQGAGLFAIWFAAEMQRMLHVCEEQGLEWPVPEDLKMYPIAVAKAMSERVNKLLPPDLHLSIITKWEPRTKGHKHFDRHGSEIPCETYHFLHDREGYGHIGMWQSPHGVVVSTQWIGDDECRFQTRIHAPGTDWHGRVRNYPDEQAAIQGHSDAVAHVATEGPGTWLHDNPRQNDDECDS